MTVVFLCQSAVWLLDYPRGRKSERLCTVEEEIPVTIGKVDEVVEIELVNEFITGNIELTKVDKDYPDNKLTGAVLKSLPIPTKMASTTRKMSCLAKCLSLAAASTR